ncbi:MAG: YebC/PmpR family DNA-binding transcriptional regulator [Candidatus Omnitrophota bacterium]
MSGHSKWASIKHKKGALDVKKGAAYTKVIREITAAARQGGGNPDINPALRQALLKAKEVNMPSDNVDRAIKRGTGELPGISYESVIYEGYGPAGVAIYVEALTDNKNRSSAELRNIFSKKSGNLAGAGSVSWMFQKKGYILIDKKTIEEDKLMSIVLDAGAEDMKSEGVNYEITCKVQDLENIKNTLQQKGIATQVAEITMIPSSTIKVTGTDAKQVLTLVEALEEQEDVQQVYANFDIPDEILDQVATS